MRGGVKQARGFGILECLKGLPELPIVPEVKID
jgi:hypothetical protein